MHELGTRGGIFDAVAQRQHMYLFTGPIAGFSLLIKIKRCAFKDASGLAKRSPGAFGEKPLAFAHPTGISDMHRGFHGQMHLDFPWRCSLVHHQARTLKRFRSSLIIGASVLLFSRAATTPAKAVRSCRP